MLKSLTETPGKMDLSPSRSARSVLASAGDRNLQAAITQQIDCLRELGRLDQAEQRWRDAHDLLPRLTEYRAEAEARLLGQLAHLRLERRRGEPGGVCPEVDFRALIRTSVGPIRKTLV